MAVSHYYHTLPLLPPNKKNKEERKKIEEPFIGGKKGGLLRLLGQLVFLCKAANMVTAEFLYALVLLCC